MIMHFKNFQLRFKLLSLLAILQFMSDFCPPKFGKCGFHQSAFAIPSPGLNSLPLQPDMGRPLYKSFDNFVSRIASSPPFP